jgi:hypothetical protein
MQRIALFSLGTMAIYRPCREQLQVNKGGGMALSPLLQEVIKFVKESLGEDEIMGKYLNRLKQKLKAQIE